MINKYWVVVNYKYNQASPVKAIKDQKQAGGNWVFTHLNFSRYNLSTPSKDQTGNTMPTGTKMIPRWRIEILKNHTLPIYIPLGDIHATFPKGGGGGGRKGVDKKIRFIRFIGKSLKLPISKLHILFLLLILSLIFRYRDLRLIFWINLRFWETSQLPLS